MQRNNRIRKRYGVFNVTDPDHLPENYGPILSKHGTSDEEIFLQVLAIGGPLYFVNMSAHTTEQETELACVFEKIIPNLWPFALMPAYVKWCNELRLTKQRLDRNERRRLRYKQNRSAKHGKESGQGCRVCQRTQLHG